MVDLVKEKGKHKYFWINYINQRIRKNKNFLFIISGPTGSGKSWSGLAIGEMLNEDFGVGKVIFRGKELMALVNSDKLKKKKGIFILWDEAGIDLSNRNWQQTANRMINFLMQTFRNRCFVLCFTAPYSDFIDKATRKLFHGEFKTISIDHNKRKVKTKPFLIQYNARSGKFYYKYLRVATQKEGVVPIVEWNIPAPSKELIKNYETKKEGFTGELNKMIEVELNKEDIKPERTSFYKIFDTKSSPGRTGFNILECWRVGEFDNEKIAKKLKLSTRNIQEVSKTLRKQGFLQEEARLYYKEQQDKANKKNRGSDNKNNSNAIKK